MAVLIIFAGLPGVGKSTIAAELARCLEAVYLRADTIEQAMRDGGLTNDQIGGNGYWVACCVASENLRLGRTVVVDSVNPWLLTREMYRKVATDAGVRYLEVEVVCSDRALHRTRAEGRKTVITGHTNPTWREIEERDYHPWDTDPLRIDTSNTEPADVVRTIRDVIDAWIG